MAQGTVKWTGPASARSPSRGTESGSTGTAAPGPCSPSPAAPGPRPQGLGVQAGELLQFAG
jgi:hypothetical protein